MSVADEANIDAYFERIGFSGSIAPSLDTLNQLCALHAAAIPFENLDTLSGSPVRLDLANIEQKLLFDRRGGFCLEHNLLLAAVLTSLDYEVRLHGARMLWGHPEDAERPLNHLVLTVAIAGGSYLVDVGFGGVTPTAALRLRAEAEQATPHETFRLVDGAPEWRLQVRIGEEWRSVYAFERTDLPREGIAEMHERTTSGGNLRENLVVTRAERGRRLALRNLRLTTRAPGEAGEQRVLSGLAELKDVLTGSFGIALPGSERIETALQRLVEREQQAGNP